MAIACATGGRQGDSLDLFLPGGRMVVRIHLYTGLDLKKMGRSLHVATYWV